MGGCSSKKISLDIKGNDNYVLLINGQPINFQSVLSDVMNQINAQNHAMMVVFYLSCIFLILLLGIIIMSALLFIKNRSKQSNLMMQYTENAIIYLNRKLNRIAFHIEHLLLFLSPVRSNGQTKNICVDERAQSIV